jgi:regulator of sigma E protease
LNVITTVIISILVFGFLIFIHEFGHYIFARIFNVTITEFSIGMGPKLLWYDSKKTGIRYCLSAIPIGGYVAMVGEDGESDDPNSFGKKPAWQRLIITVAGATVNIVAGFIAIVIFVSLINIGNTKVNVFYKDVYGEVSSYDTGLRTGDEIISVGGVKVTTYKELAAEVNKALEPVSLTVIRDKNQITLENVIFPQWENSEGKYALVDFDAEGDGLTVGEFYKHTYSVSSNASLQVGDQIIRIGGTRVYMADEVSYEIMRKGNKPIDIVVIRDGQEITLENVVFPKAEDQGQIFGLMDFKVDRIEKNLFSVLGYSFSKAALTVKMCGESLIDLMTGRYTLAAVSGPVGISQVIGQAANQGVTSLLSIVSLISINLGAMNLLPIPALDGGRTLMILIEMITKKKLPPNVEATINAVGLIVLLGLSVIIMIKDVIGLFG